MLSWEVWLYSLKCHWDSLVSPFPILICYMSKCKCEFRSECHSENVLFSFKLNFVDMAWRCCVWKAGNLDQYLLCNSLALFNVPALRNSLWNRQRRRCRHLWDDVLGRVQAEDGKLPQVPDLLVNSWLNEKTFNFYHKKKYPIIWEDILK